LPAGIQGRHDSLPIGQGILGCGHRRLQVGHDDSSPELGSRMVHRCGKHLAIAQMQVPIIGPGDGQAHWTPPRLIIIVILIIQIIQIIRILREVPQ